MGKPRNLQARTLILRSQGHAREGSYASARLCGYTNGKRHGKHLRPHCAAKHGDATQSVAR
eukprot:12984461-Alexandrium_andersonii.AAC.1